MMLYPAMKDLLEKVPSRYELVNVVACKARRIARDAEMAGEPLAEKPVSIAIQAVANGELDVKPEEMEQPEE
ncbi:DNA-directed RNA polymerase subunit omega [Pseudoflavonifractor sp. 60]|uniref:DNA-directed RNA polymerase subunit omega n=1 Tax=Pseudoflavonifractor sp. 60 TaxID=2304576 RepID=UPI0013701B6A|nr:DNA-directed RNA polymerase subunit omega [Pseudoflavonifractor sp. 60]NBI66902.1 DNA-directed RNA polymerase subunit omega [Pseudoflavonifractor sp. 60]